MNTFVEAMKWRYATKKFDAQRAISNDDLEVLKESIRLSPSSFGLQSFEVLIVNNKQVQEELQAASFNQVQVGSASHVFVFCARTEVSAKDVNDYANRIASARKVEVSSLEGFQNMILGYAARMTKDQILEWNAKQTYIALGHLMSACAVQRIDSCPMEGFDADKYDEILGLEEKGLRATVVLPVGYRSDDEPNQKNIKTRKSSEELFTEI